MIITIFGATGMVGKELILHCQAKGYTVRAFGRNVESLIDKDLRDKNLTVIKGGVFDTGDVLKAVTGADAVLTALGGAADGTDITRSLGIKNIIAQMQKAGVKRIIGIGGLGVLNVDENTMLLNTPDYPAQYVAVGQEHLKAYEYLAASNTDWTFVCPPNIIPKAADGNYVTNANYPTTGWEINAGNLALFMVQEITRNQFVKQRVGISNN